LHSIIEKDWSGKLLKSKTFKEMQRKMIKYFLDVVILAELKKTGALSGYDIMELVHNKFGFLLSSGTVYTLLYSMERRGLIEGKQTVGKRKYVLSDEGIDVINAILRSKEEIRSFMETLF
jgi:DNA-binding PadR family transcriptional regulator